MNSLGPVSYNYEAMGQVNVDLRQQWDDLSIERLVEVFVVSKMTGLEKPVAVEFEEFQLETSENFPTGQQSGLHLSQNLQPCGYLDEASIQSQSSSSGKVREGRKH